MKLITDIPCIDCITFPVCNAQISDDTPVSDVRINLISKCSLIQEYAEGYSYEASSLLVLQTAVFFKPKKSFEGYINFTTVNIINSKVYKIIISIYRAFMKGI